MNKKFAEIKEKNETELRKMLALSREQLRDLRFRVSQAQVKNVSEVRKLRRKIARTMTALRNVNKK